MRGVEDVTELPRGVSGVGEIGGGLVDDPAGGDVVVGPDPAGALLGGQSAAQLPQQLRQPGDHDGELGDDPVELRGAGQRVLVQGAVVQLADGLGCGGGQVDGGRRSGTWRALPAGDPRPRSAGLA